jgi:hypothetical protein
MKRTHAARYALGALALAEAAGAVLRHRERTAVFTAAELRARALGKPLLVVGDPDAGAHTSIVRAYGCGDVCVDLNGCPQCPVSHAVDLTRERTPVADGSAVVFASCVLEYVTDPESAWRELLRMAGTPDNVFLVAVQPWTATSVYYPRARWIVTPNPGSAPTFRPVTTLRTAAWSAAIAAGVTAAVLPERQTRENPGLPAGEGAEDDAENEDADAANAG